MTVRAPTRRNGTVRNGTTSASPKRTTSTVERVGAAPARTGRNGLQSYGNLTATEQITGGTVSVQPVIFGCSRATPPGFEPGLPT